MPTRDSLLVDEELGLFVIADGLGGHSAGQVASKLAVEEIGKCIQEGTQQGRNVMELMREAIFSAHHTILEKASRNPQLRDMGTTVVAAFFDEDRVLVAHAGDSRAYYVLNGSIRQLTEDHTYVATWLREGRITPEQARLHKAKHGLKLAVGIERFDGPEARQWPTMKDSCVLLCSDGLHDMLDDSELLDVIATSRSPQEACNRLVGTANWKGGEDNITVVLICP